MRKRFLVLILLTFAVVARPAAADPLRITGGTFALDIEGDMFTFNGDGFQLATTGIGIYAAKAFPGHPCPAGAPFGFCAEAEGSLADWSFQTTGGEQLLGTGNAELHGTSATNVNFMGSMRFDVVPTALTPENMIDTDLVAPFSFTAMIRGLRGGEELFARQFSGRGLMRVNYEPTLRPGILAADDETIKYEFASDAAPVPEPGTLLLLGSGLVGAALRRRRGPA